MRNSNADTHSPLTTFLIKIGVWAGLFGVLWILRSFSLLIFLTFVFAYIQAKAVARLEKRLANRTVRVILVGVAFLTAVAGVITFLTPHVRDQSTGLVRSLPHVLRQFDDTLYDLRKTSPLAADLIPPLPSNGQESPTPWDIKRSPSAQILEGIFGFASEGDEAMATKEIFERVLLFSFLIVLDLPELTRGVRRLRESRVAFIYEVVGSSISEFARVLGSALEAQFYIAILNTI
jgi:predicted PurR-regulated permease PerM